MRQVIQSVRSGELSVTEVPAPRAGGRRVLVQTAASLISAGTERTLVDFASKNLLQKARSRPDLVRQTLDKAQRDGLLTTLEAVQHRLDEPMPLGYSCAGTVVEVGQDTPGLRVGDRVACAGSGYAVHAELVSVPRTLVVQLPDQASFEAGAFATLGAIALHGIRLSGIQLGEVAAVVGLGLVGQLTLQMLRASGCSVIGMDLQQSRADLACRLGADTAATTAENMVAVCRQYTGGRGVDVVFITADTRSSEPIELAGEIARDRGTIIAVGAVGLTIPRKPYYEKELAFRVSRSYGPGRYDAQYEENGQDYPYAFVRWTEQRNLQAFLSLVASGKIDVQALITHRFAIEQAARAYTLIQGRTGEPFMGVLLTYPSSATPSTTIDVNVQPDRPSGASASKAQRPVVDRVRVGVLGAGSFANGTFLPAVKASTSSELVAIVSGRGLSARAAADRFGFQRCGTDVSAVLDDALINTVAILTRHDLHAAQVVAALAARKHVFVEKPLCLTHDELARIVDAYQDARAPGGDGVVRAPLLMVDFNRRFAPFIREVKEHLVDVREPLMLHYRVNAGYLPADHWTQQVEVGGGRLLGEACHFIDLLIYLTGRAPLTVSARALPNSGLYANDNLLITLEFSDGSLGTISYVANGAKNFGKEYLEVFGGGLSVRLDDFRTLRIVRGRTRIERKARLRQDKGHQATWSALVDYVSGQAPMPMTLSEVVCSTRVSLAAQDSLERGVSIRLRADAPAQAPTPELTSDDAAVGTN